MTLTVSQSSTSTQASELCKSELYKKGNPDLPRFQSDSSTNATDNPTDNLTDSNPQTGPCRNWFCCSSTLVDQDEYRLGDGGYTPVEALNFSERPIDGRMPRPSSTEDDIDRGQTSIQALDLDQNTLDRHTQPSSTQDDMNSVISRIVGLKKEEKREFAKQFELRTKELQKKLDQSLDLKEIVQRATELKKKKDELSNSPKKIKLLADYFSVSVGYVAGTVSFPVESEYNNNETFNAEKVLIGLVLMYAIHWATGEFSDAYKSVVSEENRNAFMELVLEHIGTRGGIKNYSDQLSQYVSEKQFIDIIVEESQLIIDATNILDTKFFDGLTPSLMGVVKKGYDQCVSALVAKMAFRNETPLHVIASNRMHSAGIWPYVFIKACLKSPSFFSNKLDQETQRAYIEYTVILSQLLGVLNDATDVLRDTQDGTRTTKTALKDPEKHQKLILNRAKDLFNKEEYLRLVCPDGPDPTPLIEAVRHELVSFIVLQSIHPRYQDGEKRRITEAELIYMGVVDKDILDSIRNRESLY